MYVYYGGYNTYTNLQTEKKDVINFEIDQSYAMLNEVETTSMTKSRANRSGAGGRGRPVPKSAGRVMDEARPGNMPPPPPAPMNKEVFGADLQEDPVMLDVANIPVEEPMKMVEKAELEVINEEIDLGLDMDDIDMAGEIIANKDRADGFAKKGKKMGENRRIMANQKEIAIGQIRYYRAREFFAPKYEDKKQPTVRSDFRSTVYWNPTVTVGKDGKALLSFYNSDDITQFRVTVEGFGNAGEVGRVEQKYFIQLPVELVTKIPAEVLTGDKLFIPITLTNNTDASITNRCKFGGT